MSRSPPAKRWWWTSADDQRHVSKDWKWKPRFFQALENLMENFPSLGKPKLTRALRAVAPNPPRPAAILQRRKPGHTPLF
jgi:hypothetical protein